MDLATLTKDLAAFLIPFLPLLTKLGEKATEEAGKKLGGDAWEQAKTLWGKLQPRVQAKPAAQEAMQDAVQHPENADAQAALRQQFKKLLSADEAFAAEIAPLVSQATQMTTTVIASGTRSIAIGGGVSGSTISTGGNPKGL